MSHLDHQSYHSLEATAVLSTGIVLTILAIVPYIVPSSDQDDIDHTRP